jgi:hypothetical protein
MARPRATISNPSPSNGTPPCDLRPRGDLGPLFFARALAPDGDQLAKGAMAGRALAQPYGQSNAGRSALKGWR